jgi:hypothetical protein
VTSTRLSPADFAALRQALADLPRANHFAPNQPINPEDVYAVPEHRAALDPDRALVVGNRGMGKSFWAHALAQEATRERAAKILSFKELARTTVHIGFNAGEEGLFAPSAEVIAQIKTKNPELIWRAVLVRIAASHTNDKIPKRFADLVDWVADDAERAAGVMTRADSKLVASGHKLLVVFDALDRLGDTWQIVQDLTRGLLKQTLKMNSYRAIRMKLFMRVDQFSDRSLFNFPDASKVQNNRVDLFWRDTDLYGLLLMLLSRSDAARALERLISTKQALREAFEQPDRQKQVIDTITGEFMGKDAKRGRVYTWLPLHLADAFMHTSPRTFLTVWQEAGRHTPAPKDRAVDHLGIAEGVRKASEDRLHELKEDYWWITAALAPLRDELVPMPLDGLKELWRQQGTAKSIMRESSATKRLAPVQLVATDPRDQEAALVSALQAIGVLEIRSNQKINVPDIFRIEAQIKRKGGVKPPRRTGS